MNADTYPWPIVSAPYADGSQDPALLISSQSFEQTFECTIQTSKSGIETYPIFCVFCDLNLLIDSILIDGRLNRSAVKQTASVNITCLIFSGNMFYIWRFHRKRISKVFSILTCKHSREVHISSFEVRRIGVCDIITQDFSSLTTIK